MPLPTVADAKSYLRIEHADEDVLVGKLLARAQAAIEAFLCYPFVAAERTFVEYGPGYRPDFIQLPGPFALSPAPVVTGPTGSVIASTSYVLDQRGGKIRANTGGFFGTRPITVVATIGLSAHPDYAVKYEALAGMAVLDLVAHKYQNRNPGIASESDEGGGSVNMGGIGSQDMIPPPIVQDILLLPCTVGLVMA